MASFTKPGVLFCAVLIRWISVLNTTIWNVNAFSADSKGTGLFLLKAFHQQELVVLKSRFIAKLAPCQSFEEASAIIKANKEAKASHNCWAYRSRDGYERFSDDGEPGGTAGRPILSALEAEGIVDGVALVTRYFGGTKLGTGGLTRAYGQAVRDALQTAPKELLVNTSHLSCTVNANQIGVLYRLAGQSSSILKVEESFTGSDVKVVFVMPEKECAVFASKLHELTKGSAKVAKL